MLGVATMIVVNSVMAGFADKMRDRLHGVLADVVVESYTLNGFDDWKEVMARIKEVAGDDVEAMAPTMEMPGHHQLPRRRRGRSPARSRSSASSPEERAKTGDFAEFLVDGKTGKPIPPSFDVPEAVQGAHPGRRAAQGVRRTTRTTRSSQMFEEELRKQMDEQAPDSRRDHRLCAGDLSTARGSADQFIAPPGTQVGLLFPRFGETKSEAGFDTFTTVGYFKSGMSEYDSTHVYVPLERLQKIRLLLRLDRGDRRGQPDPDQGPAGRQHRQAGR